MPLSWTESPSSMTPVYDIVHTPVNPPFMGPKSASSQAVAKALDPLARLFQRLVRRGVRNAEERRKPKRRAMHHRHARRFQQFVREIAVGGDHLAAGRLFADQL